MCHGMGPTISCFRVCCLRLLRVGFGNLPVLHRTLTTACLLPVQMDSEVQRDGRVLDLTDDAWREDRLPYEDVTIPLSELPEAEQDNGGSTESVKEQEMKWSDLALQSLHENTSSLGS
ncbi:anaphase-promoting complex subunit 13 isoform X1 [Myxocyprinus asiaticus]|uniref:anaphase-promoting complex subunit 13 isoform X1 n=1 Tax=Myxocyprinus asiaticus TaxID=70543 RepID=UPI0022221740|nr:anaphase-promoting complex subunit 13 isoform X1 [Myxocyprinus asiaticus]